MTDRIYGQLLYAFLFAVILSQAVFAAFPGIDLAVSGLFANGSAGFPWANGPAVVINLLLRSLAELLIVGLVLWCLYGGLTGLLQGSDLRAWGFAAISVMLASGGIVNLVLKAHVGRARPGQVSDFGGEAQFTPAWQVTDQCVRNCSFSSGEVSLSASLAFAALVLLWPRLRTPWARILAGLMATLYIGVVAMLRIGLGRHFLSDAVFSVLVSAAVALVLYPALRIAQARLAFDPMLPFMIGQRWYRHGRLRARDLVKGTT
ncbi:MAG: phosphatase PAP2 family protein [Paracoccaceae bacterium]